MTIDGLPDSLSKKELLGLLGVMGIDPTYLVTLSFELHTVTATVYALNTEGRHIINSNDEAVTHKVVIPIV